MKYWAVKTDQAGLNGIEYLGDFDVLSEDGEIADKAQEDLDAIIGVFNEELPFGESIIEASEMELIRFKDLIDKALTRKEVNDGE